MVMRGIGSKARNESDDQGQKILRTPEKVKEWSSGAEQSERLLNRGLLPIEWVLFET